MDRGKIRSFATAGVCAALVALIGFFSAVRGSTASTGRDERADIALNNCAAYCAAHDFKTELTGKITAKVFGVPYSQKVSGGRAVFGGSCVDFVESASTFVKAAIKKTYSDGSYFVSKGKYRKGGFTYGEPTELSQAEYAEKYGKPSLGLVKYELSGAVVGSKTIGDNEYEYVLDPSRATAYCKNEIKTAIESKSDPTYETVTVKLVVDGEKPIRVTVCENFRVEKFGGTFVSAEYTEVFSF